MTQVLRAVLGPDAPEAKALAQTLRRLFDYLEPFSPAVTPTYPLLCNLWTRVQLLLEAGPGPPPPPGDPATWPLWHTALCAVLRPLYHDQPEVQAFVWVCSQQLLLPPPAPQGPRHRTAPEVSATGLRAALSPVLSSADLYPRLWQCAACFSAPALASCFTPQALGFRGIQTNTRFHVLLGRALRKHCAPDSHYFRAFLPPAAAADTDTRGGVAAAAAAGAPPVALEAAPAGAEWAALAREVRRTRCLTVWGAAGAGAEAVALQLVAELRATPYVVAAGAAATLAVVVGDREVRDAAGSRREAVFVPQAVGRWALAQGPGPHVLLVLDAPQVLP